MSRDRPDAGSEALIEIRRHRLRLIAAGNAVAIARQNSTDYIDEDAVKAELLWARRLCNRRGWPVIDVTRRSIEETAATVLQLMEAWHDASTQGRRRQGLMLQRPTPCLILASASASRRALLTAAGLKFEMRPADIDEAAVKQSRASEGRALPSKPLCVSRISRRRLFPQGAGCAGDRCRPDPGVATESGSTSRSMRQPLSRSFGRCEGELMPGNRRRLPPRARSSVGNTWLAAAHDAQFQRRVSGRYLALEGDAAMTTVGAYRLEGLGAHLFRRSKAISRPCLGFRFCRCCPFCETTVFCTCVTYERRSLRAQCHAAEAGNQLLDLFPDPTVP